MTLFDKKVVYNSYFDLNFDELTFINNKNEVDKELKKKNSTTLIDYYYIHELSNRIFRYMKYKDQAWFVEDILDHNSKKIDTVKVKDTKNIPQTITKLTNSAIKVVEEEEVNINLFNDNEDY